jgi:hypothetical protein
MDDGRSAQVYELDSKPTMISSSWGDFQAA